MNAAAQRPPRPGQSLSVGEVHQRLPLVRAIVKDIVHLHRDLSIRRERLDQVRRVAGGRRSEDSIYAEEVRQIEDELYRDEAVLKGFVTELRALKGDLRDGNTGRVEFLGQLGGSPVLFGWQWDDEHLSYWRPRSSEESERHLLLEDSAYPESGPDGEPTVDESL